MFDNKRTVRAPDGRLIVIEKSVVSAKPDSSLRLRRSAIAADETNCDDPSQIGAKIDPAQHGAKIDPAQHGAKIDPSQLGAKIDPSQLEAKIDPAQCGAKIQPTD